MSPPIQIETERLSLSPFEPRDLDGLHRLWTSAEVRRYLWDDRVVTREEVADQIAASMRSFDDHGFGLWTLHTKEVAAFAGACGLARLGEPLRVEILYALDPAYWALGLATEAARAVLRFGFEHCRLERVHAGADRPNVASLRVMERLGMARDEAFDKGDVIYYSLAPESFRPGESYFAIRRSADE